MKTTTNQNTRLIDGIILFVLGTLGIVSFVMCWNKGPAIASVSILFFTAGSFLIGTYFFRGRDLYYLTDLKNHAKMEILVLSVEDVTDPNSKYFLAVVRVNYRLYPMHLYKKDFKNESQIGLNTFTVIDGMLYFL